jgi:hypothetical protein
MMIPFSSVELKSTFFLSNIALPILWFAVCQVHMLLLVLEPNQLLSNHMVFTKAFARPAAVKIQHSMVCLH